MLEAVTAQREAAASAQQMTAESLAHLAKNRDQKLGRRELSPELPPGLTPRSQARPSARTLPMWPNGAVHANTRHFCLSYTGINHSCLCQNRAGQIGATKVRPAEISMREICFRQVPTQIRQTQDGS